MNVPFVTAGVVGAALVLAAGGAAAPRVTPLAPEVAPLVSALNAAKAAELAAKDAYDRGETQKLGGAIATMNARQAAAEDALKAAGPAGLPTRYGSLVAAGLRAIRSDDEGFAAEAEHPPKELPEMVGEVLRGAIARKDELVALLHGYTALAPPQAAVQAARLDDAFDDLLQAVEAIDQLSARVHATIADEWTKGDGPWTTDGAQARLRAARRQVERAPASPDTNEAKQRIDDALRLLDPVDRDLYNGEFSGDPGDYVRNGLYKELDGARAAIEAAMKADDRALARRAPAVGAAGALSISPVVAAFDENARATTYSLTVNAPPGRTPVYSWSLRLTAVDAAQGVDLACDNHGVDAAQTPTFVWHHGNKGDPLHDDDCDHTLQGRYGHQGVVRVTVTVPGWRCQASYKGTNSSTPDAVALGIASRPKCVRTG